MPPPYPISPSALARDTDVEFYTAGGPGGQHRNKTESGVRLHHRPSGVRVSATERRSQSANLAAAFERLTERLRRLNAPKLPRVPTRVPTGERRRRRDDKVRTGRKKRARGPVRDEE